MEEVEYQGKKVRVVNGQLYLQQMGIDVMDDIKGLENLKDLEGLYLQSNKIEEISGLKALKNLKTLLLHNNKITEIKGLENLKSLEVLNLLGNKISQVIALKNLTNLKILNLSENSISSITGLENLKNLEQIYLNKNQITEIKGFESLNSLKKLFIGENPIPVRLIDDLGGLNPDGKANEPQKFVKYCNHMENIVIEMVLDPIPKSTSMDKDILETKSNISDLNDFETETSKISDEEEINSILSKIRDLLNQNEFIEALELLENGRELAIKNEFDDMATDIYIEIQNIKNQRINFHIDNALKIFKNTIKCTISDVNEYLSSILPDFNINETKLKLKLMSRINALNINAIFNGNFIIFKDSILIQQNLLEPQSLNSHTINSHQPLITEKKDCIYCGESIDMEAKICPYCGIFQEDD